MNSEGRKSSGSVCLVFLFLLLSAGFAQAKPGKIFLHIQRDEIIAGGASFGSAGAYEKIAGTAEFRVDPNDPRNAIVTDVDLAPRDGDGLVTFDADFMVLRPANVARWNRQLVSAIHKRGGSLLCVSFHTR